MVDTHVEGLPALSDASNVQQKSHTVAAHAELQALLNASNVQLLTIWHQNVCELQVCKVARANYRQDR